METRKGEGPYLYVASYFGIPYHSAQTVPTRTSESDHPQYPTKPDNPGSVSKVEVNSVHRSETKTPT